ncbi:hypothetical protein HELRODRAFT_169949 [Helobdella robusta]|uniref:Thyroglobulin type-1 domain-containing protein n=1 Tax=Helobdella robusta TaxID=6412 RepID=T1F2G9_HELRO|nr:hypothetical protein HELRODRAFT_169949 [Helobdella robusta]ESO08210.1 hypothetical protein HELRODRAFT_169949 [Helobdella robusta]
MAAVSVDGKARYQQNMTSPTSQPTKCQLTRSTKNPYVVHCLNDGSFDPIQCHDVTKECWCVDEDGEYIQNTIVKMPRQPICNHHGKPFYISPEHTFTNTGKDTPQTNYVTRTSTNQEKADDGQDEDANYPNLNGKNLHNNNNNNHNNNNNNNKNKSGSNPDHSSNKISDTTRENQEKNKNNPKDDSDDADDDAYNDDDDDYNGSDDDDETETSSSSSSSSVALAKHDPVFTVGISLIVIAFIIIIVIITAWIIHRFRRKDEGSYVLAVSELVTSSSGYSITKNSEYFA